jgi:hypothetical protein
LGGFALSELLRLKACAKEVDRTLTGRSIVLLFLQGGPPHIEFFDPKMSAPVEYRSVTGELKTTLPGITFGGTFPKLAEIAHRLAVVRSYASGNGGHTYAKVMTAGNVLKATPGAIFARVRGANHPTTGMPTNQLVLPEGVQPGLKLPVNFETSALPGLVQPGLLGASHGAFQPSGKSDLWQDMQLRLTPERLNDRRSLLTKLDQLRRRQDASPQLAATHEFRQQAFDMITRGVAEAFDLTREDPRTIERYDTSHLFQPERFQKYKDMGRVTNQLGRQMLLARRLCEAGCGFVTVSDCGWDMHADGKDGPTHMEGLPPMGRQVDHAVRAFLDDLHSRGLSEKILLVVTGEMGRTPRINKTGGRDHWGDLTSLLLAGGGLKMGQVIGRSDATASKPNDEAYGPRHLLSTLMRVVFDMGEIRVRQDLPNKLKETILDGEPIAELF